MIAAHAATVTYELITLCALCHCNRFKTGHLGLMVDLDPNWLAPVTLDSTLP